MSLIDRIGQSIEKAYEDKDSVESLGEVFLTEVGSKVTFAIEFNKNKNPSLSIDAQMAQAIDDLLQQLNEPWMYDLAFEHYNERIQSTSYGTMTATLLEKHQGDAAAANREIFQIYHRADLKKSMQLIQINLSQDQENETYLYSSMRFAIPWDEEHGMVYVFKNMEFQGIE